MANDGNTARHMDADPRGSDARHDEVGREPPELRRAAFILPDARTIPQDIR
jgi:hypothetical protein